MSVEASNYVAIMKQALEALKSSRFTKVTEATELIGQAIDAAEQHTEAEKQEPVGEAYLCEKCHTPFDGAWECPSCGHNTSTKEAVYTHPYVPTERQPKRSVSETHKPLTDEQVEKIIKANMSLQMNLAGIRQDFEADHGIKE